MWQFLFWPPDGHLPPLEWPEQNSRRAEKALHSLTTPSEWKREADKESVRGREGERERERERERESRLCPFLDIVDNHNNRDKFHSALPCVIARGVCSAEQVGTYPIGAVFICLVKSERQRRSRGEEKYSS